MDHWVHAHASCPTRCRYSETYQGLAQAEISSTSQVLQKAGEISKVCVERERRCHGWAAGGGPLNTCLLGTLC